MSDDDTSSTTSSRSSTRSSASSNHTSHSLTRSEINRIDLDAATHSFMRSQQLQSTNPTVIALAQLARTVDVKIFVDQILAKVTDPETYRRIWRAVKNYIAEHPYQTAFMVAGLVLLVNPLALIGFGVLGPIAGSIAALLQSTFGGFVTAGSLFSFLQSCGMVFGGVIPAIGGAIVGAVSAVALAGVKAVRKIGRWILGWFRMVMGL